MNLFALCEMFIYIKLYYLLKNFHIGMGEVLFARTCIVYKYKNAKILRASRAVFIDISLIGLNQSQKVVNLCFAPCFLYKT